MEKLNKERIVLSLRRVEEKNLEKSVGQRFLDMDIELRYMDESSKAFADSCPLIRNSEIFDKREDELFSVANENTKKYFKPVLYSMNEVARCILKGGRVRNLLAIPNEEPENMYVLTNDQGYFGAGVIMNGAVLSRIWEMVNMDYFILPSSVHEVILVPNNGKYEINELVNTVKEVNRTVLSEEDKLSDSVYLYEHNMGMLIKVA